MHFARTLCSLQGSRVAPPEMAISSSESFDRPRRRSGLGGKTGNGNLWFGFWGLKKRCCDDSAGVVGFAGRQCGQSWVTATALLGFATENDKVCWKMSPTAAVSQTWMMGCNERLLEVFRVRGSETHTLIYISNGLTWSNQKRPWF